MTPHHLEADRLAAEGDQLSADGRHAAALEKYLAAEALEKRCPTLYAKLIATHQAVTTEWTAGDFARSMQWEMRKQELEHPELKAVHERLAPEWGEVTERLRRLIIATDEPTVLALSEEIAAFGEHAVRPLLDFVLLLKSARTADTGPDEDAT